MGQCELSGKGPSVKNRVSHSNIKTKFRVQPNIQKKQLFSSALGRSVRLFVAASTIRSIEHQGGFDAYILKTCDENMSKRALEVKRKIERQLRSRKGAKNETKN
jgi:large subunit ribosomal protein L28